MFSLQDREFHHVIHYAHFLVNPLDTDIPVPWEFHRGAMDAEGCQCPEGALHHPLCKAFPIYAEVAWDLEVYDFSTDFLGGWPVDEYAMRLKWMCSWPTGPSSVCWHQGDEINGPTHWCELQRRVVTLDEEL
ncbi:MAG TPA: hypothetical protein VHL57_02355 [Flavobacteriales bacterium]|jgi:hypothetical protein|nr:hypothetical protein [Flavobacteriales bacterium]